MEHLHPNLLSTEDILRILKEREIFIQNMDSLNRYELINIFNKFALPMSQRNVTKNSLSNYTPHQPTLEEKPRTVHKRILPPPENDYCSKFSRITLTLNINGKLQKRNLQEEMTLSSNKRRRII